MPVGTAVAHAHVSNAYSAHQLALIRNTVAKDCNAAEFDLFVTVARNAGLDPFRKQISAIVFSKHDKDKRRMSIITTIDGLRVIAARSQRYRPDENEPEFEFDEQAKDPATNPLGLVKAVVKIYIADAMKAGGWKPVVGVAYWDEFAPLKEIWAYDEAKGRKAPSGQFTLEGNWPRMGRLMLAKCAEAQALRKAFPEDMSGLYEGAELDRAMALDASPSELIGEHETQLRLAKVGGAGITFQLFPNTSLEAIPLGQVADRVVETVKGFVTGKQLQWFESANTHPLREFWARAPGDALEVKKVIETERARLAQADAEAEAEGADEGAAA